jgi:hypothetical protein
MGYKNYHAMIITEISKNKLRREDHKIKDWKS